MFKRFIKEHYIILIALLCLIISRIPCVFFELHGINFDEAAIDYNIFCISEFGTDRYGNVFPLYFANAASGQSALYVYLGVILTKIFGFSTAACRGVKLIGEIVTFIFGGLLIRNVFNRRTEWIFYILYIICPYFYKMTGMSYDCDMVIPVFVLCMYLAMRCRNHNKAGGYIGLGICLGLLSYSYIIAVFMIPLFIVVQLIFGWNKRYVLIETGVAFVISFPIFWYLLTLVGIAPAVYTDFCTIAPVSAYRKKDFGFSLNNIINLKYMVVTDTQSDFAGSRAFGTLYYLSWIFIPVGIFRIIKDIKIQENYRWFCGFFAAAFIPLLFIMDATTYNFTIVYFFLLAFAAAGTDYVAEHFRTIALLAGAGYAVMFGFFLKEYIQKEPYIYGDNKLMYVLEAVGDEDKVMLDTTGVFQPECYIGIKFLMNPGMIEYDEYGRGISAGSIYFNDADNYKDYNIILIRDEVDYEYETYGGGGLTDITAAGLADALSAAGYVLHKDNGYYIYSKGELR
ncbi:MAG: ArnT family glycosyltransferase [Butyrivibrio sp.]